MTDPLADHRKALAVLIRRFRRSAGVSGTELAERLGWSQSRISRMETARQSPSEYEAKEVARVLGLSRRELSELLDAVRMFDVEFVATRTAAAKGTQQRQDEIRAIEASTKDIRCVTLTVIPALLQVPEYTRALCTADFDTVGWNSEAIEGAVELRIERQKALKDKSKSFAFIVAEAALWLRYGSASALRAQLEHLRGSTDGRVFRFGIIPRAASLSVIPICGFKIHDHRLVSIDGLTGEFNLTDPEDIRRYEQAFDMLSSAAVTGKAARRMIDEVLEEVV